MLGRKKNYEHAEYFQINRHPPFIILFLKEGKRHLFEVELREHLVSKLIKKI